MSLDVERHETAAPLPGWTSPPAARSTALICLICDVTWTANGGECCWMCGEAGHTAAEAMPWSAMAPALFL